MNNINHEVVYLYVLIVGSVLLLVVPSLCWDQELKACSFNAIYQLGDSLSDTGNFIRENPEGFCAKPPYGKTIHNTTGRSSDGLLMIDYIAQSAGLPFLEAYLNPNVTSFTNGVNFAVVGVTALDKEELEILIDVASPWSNSSLNVQLQWLDTYMHHLCDNDLGDCRQKLSSSLFMVGEIGINDYNLAFYNNFTIEEVKKLLVPNVVKAVIEGVEKVINHGARHIVVPGIFQSGCQPAYLTAFESSNPDAYDELGCLKEFNEFSVYHNVLLQESLQVLSKSYPNLNILYGDLNKALRWVFNNNTKFGISVLNQSCCGTGGKYQFNLRKLCGDSGVPVCEDPNQYYSWDGEHWAQNFNKHAAQWLIGDIAAKFNCHTAARDQGN